MNKIIAIIMAIMVGVSLAEIAELPLDLEYIIGPIEVVDGTEEEEEEPEPYVYIEIVGPSKAIRYGDEVSLLCVVVGLDHTDYRIQWQYCEDINKAEYHDLNCHDHIYTFVADHRNVGYYYRVVIYPIDERGVDIGTVYQSSCTDAPPQEEDEAEVRSWTVYAIQDKPAAA